MNVPSYSYLDALADVSVLGDLFGPIRSVQRMPAVTSGFSGAQHERLCIRLKTGESMRFHLKRVDLTASWTAYRTADRTGREAAIPREPWLQPVRDVFELPYRAVAVEGHRIALLMDDLSDRLPAETRPLEPDWEENYLRALAVLHARFERSPVLELPWLATPEARLGILDPVTTREELVRNPEHPLFIAVCRGWDIALPRLSPRARETLLLTPREIMEQVSHLPVTLLHGDPKLANFAFLPDDRVAAFDWAVTGRGPLALDLGHCLAINAAQFAASRDTIMTRYRRHFEAARGETVADPLWNDLTNLTVLAGARLLLWSRGLALESDAPGAETDWRWWSETLAAV